MELIDLSQFDGHTPGPWSVKHMSDISIGESTFPICSAFMLSSPNQMKHSDVPANQNLLTAAPDLLEEVLTLRARVAELERQLERQSDQLERQ